MKFESIKYSLVEATEFEKYLNFHFHISIGQPKPYPAFHNLAVVVSCTVIFHMLPICNFYPYGILSNIVDAVVMGVGI